jgi:hypothetical protein
MKVFFFVLYGLCFLQFSFGQVSITKPSFKFTACALPSQYIDLGIIKITETKIDDFTAGNWGFAGGSGLPLPVELISFNAHCHEGNSILTWSTASENNSAYYEIEVSSDGLNWETNGSIPASGFSTEELAYSYEIERASTLLYARLIQYDNNGDFKVFGPLAISCSSSWNMSTFPNPSQEIFNVVIRSKYSDMQGLLNIVDMSGNQISSRKVLIQEGINVFSISQLQISGGAYFIQLITENQDPMIYRHIIK